MYLHRFQPSQKDCWLYWKKLKLLRQRKVIEFDVHTVVAQFLNAAQIVSRSKAAAFAHRS